VKTERIGLATLYLADSMEVLPLKADIVLTDPPYGMKLDASYANSTPNAKKGIGASKGYESIIGDDKDFDAGPYRYRSSLRWDV
jgi:DNA modification methylase